MTGKFRFPATGLVALTFVAGALSVCGNPHSPPQDRADEPSSQTSQPSPGEPSPDQLRSDLPQSDLPQPRDINYTCPETGSLASPSGARQPLPDSSPRQDVPSALSDRFDARFEPLVDPAGIKSGGPPPEGIPTIDQPCYVPAAQVDYLSDSAPLMAVEISGDARAYPLGILTRHELVNDAVGGVPVTVSYCPLCNSGVVYDRRVGELVLDFGTSGSLYQSSLVMYDRQTQSLWTHFNGQAVVGELEGTQLDFFATQITSWQQWRQANPDGAVLSVQTGYYNPGNYNRNPYFGYESSGSLLASSFQSVEIDDRLPAKQRVIGVRSDGAVNDGGTDGAGTGAGAATGAAIAIRHDHLQANQVAHFALPSGAQLPLVAFNIAGTSSALDDFTVDQGLDVGSSAVFVAQADNRQLSFAPNPADATTFVDQPTGSTWNIFGRAIAGELEGSQLEPVVFWDTFWFAWSTFAPGTDIFAP